MKVHVGILTSRHPEKVLRCIRSLMLQDDVGLEMGYTVVVNSVKGNYFDMVEETVKAEFPDMHIINTASNGKPGMGKNAGFDYMRNSVVADYYMLIDGDDFLYPTGMAILKSFMEGGYDIITGQSQDQWSNGKLGLSWKDTQPNNAVKYNRDIIIPKVKDGLSVYSIDTLYAVSKDFIHIMPRMNEELDLYEDFLFTVEYTKMRMNGRIKSMSTNSSYIYGYDTDGEHQTGLFSSDKPLASWNVNKFFELSEKHIPVLFSQNPFAEVTNPTEFSHEDKEEFYNVINSHEAYSRTK